MGLRSLGKSFLFEPREDFLSLRALLGGESLRFGLGIKPGPVTVSLQPPRPGWRAVAPSINVLVRSGPDILTLFASRGACFIQLESAAFLLLETFLALSGDSFLMMSSSNCHLTASTLGFRVRPGKET